jgi:hypothetical protein
LGPMTAAATLPGIDRSNAKEIKVTKSSTTIA